MVHVIFIKARIAFGNLMNKITYQMFCSEQSDFFAPMPIKDSKKSYATFLPFIIRYVQ